MSILPWRSPRIDTLILPYGSDSEILLLEEEAVLRHNGLDSG